MGLDLNFLKQKDYEDLIAERKNWDEVQELGYGRKTWSIVNWFRPESEVVEDDYLYSIPKAVFEKFFKEFSDAPEILEPKLDFMSEFEDSPEERDSQEAINKYKIYANFVENFMEDNFGGPFQLGSDWDARVVVNLVKNQKNILAAYDEGPVYMEVSY